MSRYEQNRSAVPAILVMCAGVLLIVANDAIAKGLLTRYEPLHILFARNVIALPVITSLLLWFDGAKALRSGRVTVHVFRGVLAIAVTFLFFSSLKFLSLAEATSLIFAAPIFVAALSMLVLKERVGLRRGLAVVAGFLGILIVLQPGAGTLQTASFYAVGAAFVHAIIMMSARWIDRRDGFWTMTFYMSLFSCVFSAFVLATDWPALETGDVLMFVGMAVGGTFGIALMSHAFRMAEAALVAPFDYTALVWATLFGWLIWGVVPGAAVYAGAAVIIGSCLYLVLTGRRRPV